MRKSKLSKKGKRGKKQPRNKEFAAVTYFFVGLFLALMAYVVYFNVKEAGEIIKSPHNVRLDYMADRIVRGEILDRDGNVLAVTQVAEDGTETRSYPYGDTFAHVVGYDSMGKAGIESLMNFELLTSNSFIFERIANDFKQQKNIGDNVVTTLDLEMQQVANDALGSHKGAVVVSDAATGRIFAMVSKPTFQPNTVKADWDSLLQGESVLLNRATQSAYAPGSVFKIVTALEYMRENPNFSEYTFNCQGQITAGSTNTTIHCAGGRTHGEQDLAASFANSCNSSFSNIGLTLDMSSFKKTAKDLLFNSKLPCELPYRKSDFKLTKDSPDYEIMMTAMGQGNTQVSPYHMSLITSAIANDGILMKPYLIDRVETHTGAAVKQNQPAKYGRLMSADEAATLKSFMTGVVEYGTGTALKSADYTVAGKTGTAEYSNDKAKSHSWFTGFSNVDDPDIVVTAVVESADQSGMSAVGVAARIFDAYYH